jgi:hypothetical protein
LLIVRWIQSQSKRRLRVWIKTHPREGLPATVPVEESGAGNSNVNGQFSDSIALSLSGLPSSVIFKLAQHDVLLLCTTVALVAFGLGLSLWWWWICCQETGGFLI